jgi:hypothetical protein
MDTNVYTPMDVFYQPRYFNVPLFQRPYVWNEELQWQPLWQDVRRMAELRIDAPYQQARHFLGAIVLQKSDGAFDNLKTHNVIDGQQRLLRCNCSWMPPLRSSKRADRTRSRAGWTSSPTTPRTSLPQASPGSNCGIQPGPRGLL